MTRRKGPKVSSWANRHVVFHIDEYGEVGRHGAAAADRRSYPSAAGFSPSDLGRNERFKLWQEVWGQGGIGRDVLASKSTSSAAGNRLGDQLFRRDRQGANSLAGLSEGEFGSTVSRRPSRESASKPTLKGFPIQNARTRDPIGNRMSRLT